jgi:membrane protein DedA with SNARE-associated domain
MHKNADNLSEKKVLTIIGLMAGSSLLLSLANIGWWGYIVILALYAGEHVLQPFLSEVLNNRAPEAQRATVLSVASFFKTLPYVMLAPIIGYLSTNGKIEYFFVTWAILIFSSVTLYILASKKDNRLNIAV